MKEYFSHDYYARNDMKLKKVFMKFGLEGIGLYWCVVEMLYENGGVLPHEMVEVTAFDLRIGEEKLLSLLNEFDLFEKNEVGYHSESADFRRSQRDEKTTKAKASAEARWRKKRNDSNASAMQTHCECNGNKIKEKEIKGNKIKEKENGEAVPVLLLPPMGTFENVLLTKEEYSDLKKNYKVTDEKIEDLSLYMKQTGKKYDSHYATLLLWIKEDQKKDEGEKSKSYDTEEFFEAAVKRSSG